MVLLKSLKNIVGNLLNPKSGPANQGLSGEDVQRMAAIAAARAKSKIGSGTFGQVYETAPGVVTKELPVEYRQKVLKEADLQDIGARLGISPTVQTVETGPITAFGRTMEMESGPDPKVTGQIAMQDMRPTHMGYYDHVQMDPARAQAVDLQTHQQLAQLALNDVALGDRHPRNIMVNQVTGRPAQIDYGLAEKIENPVQKVANLTMHVANGFGSAGLSEEGHIFLATVNGLLLDKGDVAGAMDVAKQGLAMLQKIRKPVVQDPNYKIAGEPGIDF